MNNNSIGLFGGSFDPPHKGHMKVSLKSIKKFKLKKLYWAITNKNPFKRKTFFPLSERIIDCKKLTKNDKVIQVKCFDKLAASSRTVDIIKYLIKKNRSANFFLIIGSDNLINFHKWKNFRTILKLCNLVVFARNGYEKKARNSYVFRYMMKINKIIYIKNCKIDISSSKLREFYLR
jgi:nicotinate-nucleotide adenylyltransferase